MNAALTQHLTALAAATGQTRPPLTAGITFALLRTAPPQLAAQPTSRAFREFAQRQLSEAGLPPMTRGDLRRALEWIGQHSKGKAVQHVA